MIDGIDTLSGCIFHVMSGNYAEIVELRGSILRAIMKKNRGELTREIKRGERLKNNGALGLLLNVARLTLDMFQERNRMKKQKGRANYSNIRSSRIFPNP